MSAHSEDTKLEVLNDHYKDSFGHLQQFIKRRDWLFFLILAVIALMLFQVFSPGEASATISQFISKRLDVSATINITVIGSVMWFGLLGLLLRYFQTLVHIERQYDYIHALEERLNQAFADDRAFTRESKSYLTSYPLFSIWAWFLYTIVFPVLLMTIIVYKIISEAKTPTITKGLFAFDCAAAICIIISTLLYLHLMHFETVKSAVTSTRRKAAHLYKRFRGVEEIPAPQLEAIIEPGPTEQSPIEPR